MSDIFTPRTAVVTIWAGDDLDQIRHLEHQAEAAKEAETTDGPRLNHETPEYLDLARKHDELVKAAEARATHVRVQALPRKQWKALVAEHPPRKAGDSGVTDAQVASDSMSGVNDETFKDALVPLSIVEPDLSEADLDRLADIDFDRLYVTAFGLNRGVVADPKASLVSRLTQTNEETSS